MLPSLAFVVLSFVLFCSYPHATLQYGFPYGSRPVRGVNLGGWLVLEVFAMPKTLPPHSLTALDIAVDHSQSFRRHRKQ